MNFKTDVQHENQKWLMMIISRPIIQTHVYDHKTDNNISEKKFSLWSNFLVWEHYPYISLEIIQPEFQKKNRNRTLSDHRIKIPARLISNYHPLIANILLSNLIISIKSIGLVMINNHHHHHPEKEKILFLYFQKKNEEEGFVY